MSEKPLQPLIIADHEGCILGAHCTCMAGLGEACTHIAALLFAIEASVKLRDSKTVTEEKAYWLLPTSVKGVKYKECSEIDFTSAKTLKKKLDCKLDLCATSNSSACTPKGAATYKSKIPEPTENELSALFEGLYNTNSKPAILSLIAPYSDDYIPQPMKENFPTVLTELRDENAIQLNYSELLKQCQNTEISVTAEQAKVVENATREQSNSKLWYRFRAGRITASKMKTACCTDPTLPAQSLIKSVCYPESYKFSSRATGWGCEHEKFARDIFLDKLKLSHDNVKLEEVGFFINPDVPFIGASPDGMVSCDCCGQNVIEIKCPFCVKDSTFDDIDDKTFYLKRGNDDQLKLDVKHQYYYQVQTQLGVCKIESAYFVVWTEKDLHIEQIMFDEVLWNTICEKSKHIFVTAILPELVGKFYSRLPFSNKPVPLSCTSDNAKLNKVQENIWCFCAQVESGKMIFCDNEECPIGWFHYLCIGISCAPRTKWYCPDCRKLPKFQSKRGKKTSSK